MHLSVFSECAIFYSVLALASFSWATVPDVLVSVESLPFTLDSHRDTQSTNWSVNSDYLSRLAP